MAGTMLAKEVSSRASIRLEGCFPPLPPNLQHVTVLARITLREDLRKGQSAYDETVCSQQMLTMPCKYSDSARAVGDTHKGKLRDNDPENCQEVDDEVRQVVVRIVRAQEK